MKNIIGKSVNTDYMPPLDGLRGLACLLVVVTHTVELARLPVDNINMMGAFGVLIFFALSGFLMGALYFQKPFNENTVVKYAASRFSRIVPAYYIAITLYIVSYVFVPGPGFDVNPVEIARLYLFLSSASVFWSIPPEVQFYGFFVLIWFAWNLMQKNKPILLYGVAAVVIASYLTCTFWPGILLPSKLHIFVLGFLASLLLANETAKRFICHPAAQLFIIATVLVYIKYALGPQDSFKDLIFAILVALGVFSLSQTTIVTRILTTRVFVFMGAASFSIYLFHGMVLRLTDAAIIPLENANALVVVVVFLLAIVLPSIFHIYVEKRLNVSLKKALPVYYERMRQRYFSKLIKNESA